MKRLGKWLFIFAIIWVAFAIWNIGGSSDIVKVYSASETVDRNSSIREGSILPEYLPNAVTEYRITDTVVFSKVGDFVNRYEGCEIFDKKNWSCTYSDKSGSFGLRAGNSFTTTNKEKFPNLAYIRDTHHLSRFEYIVLNCRWDWSDSFFQMIACLTRPFST